MSDLPGAGHRTRWSYGLGALSIAICCAEVAYRAASTPEPYSQFTVGRITWNSASKGQDYALLVALLAGFACTWLILLVLDRVVERRLGTEGVIETRSLMAYVTLPSVVWATGLVLGSPGLRDPVWLSSAGIAVATALMFLATRRPFKDSQSTTPGQAAGIVLLTTALGALSALVVVFAITRWMAILNHRFLWTGEPSALWLAAAGAACGLSCGLWGWWTERSSPTRLFSVLLASQLALPWAFLLVVPTPWLKESVVTFGVPTTRILSVALVLVGVGYLDLFRRLLRTRPADPAGLGPLRALSPVAIAGALLFLKLGPLPTGALDPDDYHFGELLLPWRSLATDGAVPFWDHVPARGLINYVQGALAAVVYDGTAAGILATNPLISGLTLLLGVVSMSAFVGVLPAAGAFLLMPLWHTLNHIDIVNTAGLCVLWVAYVRLRPVAWLPLWIVIGTFAFLWAPAQGTAVVLATMPLGIWQAFRAYRAQRGELVKLTGGLVLAGAILLVATPLGRMIAGAVRYGLENSAVGAEAHAIDWGFGFTFPVPLNRWLWEAVRTSWIAVGLIGIAALVSAWVGRLRVRREPLFVVGVPVVLLTILFIYRAGGRIDEAYVSRLGFASIWMGTLLLPLLLHAAWGAGRWPAILTLTTAAGGLLVPVLGVVDLRTAARHAYEAVPPPDIEPARHLGFPNVGSAWLPAESFTRLVAIRRALDVLLNYGETYLDLTNRNAHYFYLGRRLPIESGALYNLPNDSQQLRAIETLEAAPVPVVLAWAETQTFDGGPQSYRTHAIYRYLIWRYEPVRIEGFIFLVAPDRIRRLGGRPDLRVDYADRAMLLDAVFRRSDIQALPVSWGSAWSTLEPAVSPVRRIESSMPIKMTDVVSSGPNQYRTTGAAPAIEWALAPSPLAGKDAGILTFDFNCPARARDVGLEVAWGIGGQEPAPEARVRFLSASRLAVPLDAAPRWLLAQSISALQIRLTEPKLCSIFSVSNIELWQRRISDKTDPR